MNTEIGKNELLNLVQVHLYKFITVVYKIL